jgi:putative transposase
VKAFRLIEAEKAEHRVSRLCSVLEVTRQGYYAWRSRPPSPRRQRDLELEQVVREAFLDSRETYGAPRLHAELRVRGVRVGKKRVARLMREIGLQGVSRRGRRRRARSDQAPSAPAPDLVKRRFHAERPDELWLADITYVPTWEGWLFLSIVMDVCTRRIVGWSMRDDLHADLVVDALGMAVTRRQPANGVIHHSDRGSQPELNRSWQHLVVDLIVNTHSAFPPVFSS